LAVPLAIRIHEGLVWSNRDRRTLLDKMRSLLGIVAVQEPFYFVGDAYYAAGKIANGLREQNSYLITRVKSNAVAYAPHVAQGPKKRGRPRLYGQKIALRTLLNDTQGMQQAPSPVYGEQKITLNYHVRDLLWRLGRNPGVDWEAVDDVFSGCANQAGEDNRNVARMSLLLAAYPIASPVRPSIVCAGPGSTRLPLQRTRSKRAMPRCALRAASRA
jgi:DDE superfamily endonuclease